MIGPKLFVFYSVLINLSRASRNCTPEYPELCEEGGIDITFHNTVVNNILTGKAYMSRKFEQSFYDRYLVIIRYRYQEIPEFFDAREHWPECKSISKIQHQRNCGSCWAVATAAATSDRFCISSRGRNLFDVSEQHLVSCCDACFSGKPKHRCKNGSNLLEPLAFMIQDGTVSEECQPYNISTIEQPCKTHCIRETTPYKKVKIPFLSLGTVSHNSPITDKTSEIEDMQIEIMRNGPVTTFFDYTPDDFAENYTNEVYISTSSVRSNTGHAIRVIGWGIENGVPYWLCANSWGQKWGKLGGFFKIRRGTNELGVENTIFGANMDVRAKAVHFEDDDDEDKKLKERIHQGHSRGISQATTLMIYRIIVFVLVALSL